MLISLKYLCVVTKAIGLSLNADLLCTLYLNAV